MQGTTAWEGRPRARGPIHPRPAGSVNVNGRLWMFWSEATVRSPVGRILAKLGVRDRVRAVVFCYQNGAAGSR